MIKAAQIFGTGLRSKPQKMLSPVSITLAFVLTMVVLLTNTYVLYTNMERVRSHQAEITRSNDFIEELEVTISNLKDIETGQRGFTITSDEKFLEPYYRGLKEVFENIRNLRRMAQSDPGMLEKIQRLEQLSHQSIAFQESIISLLRQKQNAAAEDKVKAGAGKAIMDSIRTTVDEIRDQEKSLLSERAARAKESSERVDRLFLFVAVVILVLGVVSYVLIYRSIVQQGRENERLAKETWVKTGLTQLSEVLRGTQSIQGIGEKTLEFFSRYIEAQVGMFYVARGQRLEAIASYAPPSVDTRSSLAFGETLTGEAFKQQRVIRLDKLSGTYLKVGTGLGEGELKDLVLAPVAYEEQPVGVIELGSLQSFDETDLELITAAMRGIGISLNAAVTRSALQDLLEETQRQAEELQAQQEELRISNEELENQTNILRFSQEKLQQQQEELRQINEELEQQTQALEAQSNLLNTRNESLELTQVELEQKAEALEKASRYKSEFLANMSHELRTPLNSLLILSTLLSENKEGNLNAKQIDFARTIYKSGNDLLALINDILDLSKVEAGKLQLLAEDVELDGLAEDLRREFSHLAADKGLSFEIEIDKALPRTIRSDKQRLEQILKNMLSNALKFTSQGQVTLSLTRGSAELPIALSVQDTGIGIAPDKQDLIFEAFEQVDRSTSRAYGGTGLGLTISRELAALLGGHIELRSQPGEGSRFTLHLPLNLPEQPVQASREAARDGSNASPRIAPRPILPPIARPPAMPQPIVQSQVEDIEASDRLVLIVEDDEAFGKSLIEIANESGFRPFLVNTGESALDIVQRHRFSAILLDIKLPDISGFGVLERLKASQVTRHIPIHIISGVDYSRNALNLGAVGYLLKPAGKSQLENVFKHLEDIISRQVKRVLVVEDDVIQREAINHLLGGNDIELVGASSAREAMEQLGKSNFDCMILDLRLPDLSGFQLLEKLETIEGLSRPPVIVYTGQDLSQEEIERLRQYSESIVIKGVRSPERLFDEVSLFLHRVETQLPPDSQALLEKLRSDSDPLVGRRVLVVDDDMRNVFAMANALNTHGMKVVVAKNGQEAIDKLEADNDIELVLMDIMMPIMDGFEAMSRLRERPKFKRLPIIALTAKAMKGDHEKCLKAGANDYLPKPVNLERLLSLMRVWLPRRHEV